MFVPASKQVNKNFSVIDSGLFDDIIAKDNKSIGFQTGFGYFDYPTAYSDINGYDMTILPNGGLFPRIYTVVGESETGKTTTMLQIAGSIAESCWGGNMVVIDAEGNTTQDRIMSLNNWDRHTYKQKCMYIPPSPPIDILRVMDIIRKIAHSKASKGEKIKVKSPYRDMYTNKFIEIYPPTVVVLDSIPALVIAKSLEDVIDGKKEYKEIEQIGQNVDGMREAMANTNFLRKVKGLLDEFNIILIMINHISKEIPMGMFDKPKKFHPGLKAGEKLSGGKEQIFQSFGLFRISQKEMIDERNPLYGDDIRGYICSLDHIKNKANVSTGELRYVFDKRTGFKPELTDFEYLNSKKIGISGSPSAMYLTILPEIKFTRKNLIEKCQDYPVLSRALSFMAKYVMGNEMILQHRFGEIDINKFASMSLETRMSVFINMTRPYPGYGVRHFGHDGMLPSQMMSVVGNQYTGLGGNYVSPVNVDVIKRIIHNEEKGFCYVNGCHYDPCPII